jgi:DNA-binding GntR family transcriptional regulator
MKIIATQPKLVAQVQEALVAEIAQGKLKPGERIIQEQIAQVLGVSRQPVQQALALLRNQGVLHDAPGRGLIVAPMDPDYVRNMYDIRAMMEGLAFRRAAELNAACSRKLGPTLIQKGWGAVASGSVAALIAADLSFHGIVHQLSRNPLIAPMMEAQWTYTQRVMGEVLIRDETPREIWSEHESMLDAVMAGDGDAAERLARQHIERGRGHRRRRPARRITGPARGSRRVPEGGTLNSSMRSRERCIYSERALTSTASSAGEEPAAPKGNEGACRTGVATYDKRRRG